MTRVHIIGPNLPDQSKGGFHVHAEGCSDVKRSKLYASPEFDGDKSYVYDLPSAVAAGDEVYADHIAEGSMEPGEGVHDLYFFPCVHFEESG